MDEREVLEEMGAQEGSHTMMMCSRALLMPHVEKLAPVCDGQLGAGGRCHASIRRRVLLGDPGGELRVCDCEHHGADEQADQPEA
jgi:hypothetical protein